MGPTWIGDGSYPINLERYFGPHKNPTTQNANSQGLHHFIGLRWLDRDMGYPPLGSFPSIPPALVNGHYASGPHNFHCTIKLVHRASSKPHWGPHECILIAGPTELAGRYWASQPLHQIRGQMVAWKWATHRGGCHLQKSEIRRSWLEVGSSSNQTLLCDQDSCTWPCYVIRTRAPDLAMWTDVTWFMKFLHIICTSYNN